MSLRSSNDATAAILEPPTNSHEPGAMAYRADAPSPVPVVGTTGRYLVIEEVTRDGAGAVQRAYDPKLQREVAIKSIEGDVLTPETQARILREARAMAQLSHPNVVSIYDAEIIENTVVIAMEHVRGTSFRVWLAGHCSWRDAFALLLAAGQGLAAVHAAGLQHGSFGLDSVLVGDDCRSRVTGFEFAV